MKAYAAFKDGEIDWRTVRRFPTHVLQYWETDIRESWATANRRMIESGYEIREIEITWSNENETKKEE